MTREQLKALGLTDEQIEGVMKQHGIDTQGFNATLTQNNTELTRLKDIEGKYNALLANQQKDEPKGEPEDPQLAEALKKIAELEEANVRKDIQTYAIAKGLSGEDAENVLKAFASNLDNAKSAIDSIANVITARETAAADAKVKELAKNTTNPGGGSTGSGAETKPDDVANAEAITFATVSKDAQSARDYYK